MHATRSVGLAVATSIAASILLAGCGSTDGAAMPTAPVTVTETVNPKPAPMRTPSHKAPSARASANPARAAAVSWTMPSEVGKVLQNAQDHIQAITGHPFFYTASDDATGQGRFQILDRDWRVCSQTPSAGTSFTEDTDITFHSVKLGEQCP